MLVGTIRVIVVPLICAIALSACTTPNEFAMQIGQPPKAEGDEGKPTLKYRVLQSRRFDTLDERRLLAAATQTFQDLGYTIQESSLDSGVLVGNKRRDAVEGGQIAGQVVLTVLAAALGSFHSPTWDQEQTIVATLTTTPVQNSKQSDIRISFDRRLINNHGYLWRSEVILDEKIYEQFFEKFAQSVFLEAHRL